MPGGNYYTKAGICAVDGGKWLSDMFIIIFSIFRKNTGTTC